ncbi:hypothetical protein, partial [Klebsiella pneumoniae]
MLIAFNVSFAHDDFKYDIFKTGRQIFFSAKPKLPEAIFTLSDSNIINGTVAKLAMRQPFVLFKGLTFQKLCL